MKATDHKKVLIAGASFAGLSSAYWMHQLGYEVTVIELAPALKMGGTPVNILGNTIEVVKRMGLFKQIESNRLVMENMVFKNADDTNALLHLTAKEREARGEEEYEIERDVLLHLLYETVKPNVKLIFNESITTLHEAENKVAVSFKNAPLQNFDLVLGCDGVHSTVRKLWFGPEAEFSKFLQTYFSITIVNELLIPEFTTQMYSEPGKTLMLNAYNGKTDICLAFFTEQEIPYNYRNGQQQRDMILEQFQTTGWRTPEMLEKVKQSDNFYFDKLCQIRMPAWTKGRVALVGDAGYCASPAAGRGGSLAIDGAAALADALQKYPDNLEAAFQEYNQSFRPFIDEIQADVINFGLNMLVPQTEEAIQRRNQQGFGNF